MYLFSTLSFKTYNGSCMVSCLFGCIFLNISIIYSGFIGERLIELNNKIVLEVFGNSSAIACTITDNFVFFWDNLNKRTFVKCIDCDIRMCVFRESEPEENSTFGRRHLRDNIVFGQIHLVVIRSCFFSFVSEPASPLFFVEFRFTHHRHNGELSVIVYPWAGLMSLFESTDFIGCIDILPSVSHFFFFFFPEIHSPRAGNGRVGVTC